MKLEVLQDETRDEPWYTDGLKFTCSQCGNCCTGGPGFVWISREEIVRLAEFLKITPEQTVEEYCRKVDGQFSLKEFRNSSGNYDCVFLKEEKVTVRAAAGGGPVVHARRRCAVYEVRPLQCRTWPFWPENLWSRKTWDHAARRCQGMNAGHRHFSREKIESLRDAKDWPQNPPTSAPAGANPQKRS
jgi:Fe-S-cluster containining protein